MIEGDAAGQMRIYSAASPFLILWMKVLLFIFQKTAADNCIPAVFFTNIIQSFVKLLEFGIFRCVKKIHLNSVGVRKLGGSYTQQPDRLSVPGFIKQPTGVLVKCIPILTWCQKLHLMRDGRKIAVFDFHVDHTGALTGVPETPGNRFGEGQEHFSGRGGLGDIGGQGCGIPNTPGNMTPCINWCVFQSIGVFPDSLPMGL